MNRNAPSEHPQQSRRAIDAIRVDGTHICIDGNLYKEMFPSVEVVKLSTFDEYICGFPWSVTYFKVVELNNIHLQNYRDAKCLCWFIVTGAKLDFAGLYINPDVVRELTKMMAKLKCKVGSGSRITLPILGSYTGLALRDNLAVEMRRLGFATHHSC